MTSSAPEADPIQALHAVLSQCPSIYRDGDYSELVDESQPNGAVAFKRKDGQVFMLMPRSAYDQILEREEAKKRSGPVPGRSA